MRDLRAALRTIAGRPWFSAAVVLTLGIGIGINTTVFTLVYAVIFKPIPFPEGERVVTIAGVEPARNVDDMNVSYPDFLDLQAQTTSFDRLDAMEGLPGVISEPGHPPERYRTARVTAGFLSLFHTPALAGRTLQPSDEAPDAAPVAVIGYTVWHARYNLATNVIGRTVRINERATTIVGVMPDGFQMPNKEDVWMPFVPSTAEQTDRRNRPLLVFALLKAGVSRQTANHDVTVASDRLAAAYPDTNAGISARVFTFNERFNGGQIRTMFYLLIAAVGLVLLIACANVANMMLSRALSRQREMTIRSALGASRWRLVRQLLTESLVLSLAGGALGITMAAWGTRAFDTAVANSGKPSWVLFTMDYAVLGYFTGICLLSALLFGLAPALRGSHVELSHVLKEGGRGGPGRMGWLSGTLVVVQFTLAVVLLTAAGLMMRSFFAGQNINGWIPRSQIVAGHVELPNARYADRDARLRFFDTLQGRVAELPGVRQLALTSALPEQGSRTRRIELDGALVSTPAERLSVNTVAVSGTYLDMVGLPLDRGRAFDDLDGTPGREAAIVTRALAARLWPQQDPIGKRFRTNAEQTPDPWMTVVGVAGDIVQEPQRATADGLAFVPYRQGSPTFLVLTVKVSGDPSALTAPLRSVVQSIDPDLPLYEVETLETLSYNQRWPYRVFGTIFGIFALAALVMAAVGLYAVMSQATNRRTREIGIRMALGATPQRILGAVLRRGALQLSIGLVLGLIAAFAATGAMRSLLLGVTPGDPLVFIGTSVLLTMVGLLACWLPARRAAAIAPVQALAEEDR